MMSGIDAAPLTSAARLALAIACVLTAALPAWGLLLWIERSAAAWRAAADNIWLRLLAGASATIGTLLIAWVACAQLLPPGSLTESRIVILVWMGQIGLLSVALGWVKKRRGGGRWNSVTRLAAQLAGSINPGPSAPYAGWKTRVLLFSEEPGRIAITLRPYRIWETIAFPLGMLVGLAVVTFIQGEAWTPQERAVSRLIMLATSLVFGLVGALATHLLAGREESVTVSGGILTIERELLRRPPVRRLRSYGLGQVMNLRAIEPSPPRTSGRYARPIPAPSMHTLEFDYQGGTVRFGAGLVGPDADLVLCALAQTSSPLNQSA